MPLSGTNTRAVAFVIPAKSSAKLGPDVGPGRLFIQRTANETSAAQDTATINESASLGIVLARNHSRNVSAVIDTSNTGAGYIATSQQRPAAPLPPNVKQVAQIRQCHKTLTIQSAEE
jgi:hypothetical protein